MNPDSDSPESVMNFKRLTVDEVEKDFMVSRKIGFLIDCSKTYLPSCWGTYEEAAENLPVLVEKNLLHRFVAEKLCENALIIPKEKRQLLKLHTVLSMLTSGYVWQDGGNRAAKRLPSCLAVPLVKVSEALGMKPIISYTSTMLSNWKLLDKDSNVVPIYTLPGGPGAGVFIRSHVVIEQQFGPVVKSILDAVGFSNQRGTENDQLLIKALSVIPQVMNKLAVTLQQMKDNLPTIIFYDRIRIYHSGFGLTNASLPDGLIYEGVDDSPMVMRGGSAAQSCTLQLLDAAFGIKHSGDEKKYLEEVREYMLKEHRDLCSYVRDQSRIREYAERSFNVSVKEAYNACIKSVEAFRRHHVTTAHEYIEKPSRRTDRNSDVESIREIGTGGEEYMKFLNRIRRNTALTKLPLD